MANSWVPSGPWKASFRGALNHVFDAGSMGLLISDYFSPQTFAGIAPAGFGKTFEVQLNEVISEAEMNGWLVDLVAAAAERRPKDSALRKLAQDLSLTTIGPRLNNQTGKTLEALVQENAKSINPAAFYQRLAVLEPMVCRVEVPGNIGTGFLVGPDLVLTNNHVVKPVINKTVSLQQVFVHFDYRLDANGTLVNQNKPVLIGLADDWLVSTAPPSDADWDDEIPDAKADECDYALIKLAEAVGDAPIGGPTADPLATKRSWIDTKVAAPALIAGNQVFLLQHALGEPLTLTIGTVTSFNGTGTRVRYNANSKKGSSGSPCFNADLQLVALHHAQAPAEPPPWNQAIPFGLIQKHCKELAVGQP